MWMLRLLEDFKLVLVEFGVDLVCLKRLLLYNLDGTGHLRTAVLTYLDHAIVTFTYFAEHLVVLCE